MVQRVNASDVNPLILFKIMASVVKSMMAVSVLEIRDNAFNVDLV